MKAFKRSGILVLALASLFWVQSCGIKKMIKDAGKISYTVTPNPLELHGDSVRITVNGNFPAKYFHKKATVVVTPVVKYQGGEKTLRTLTLKGEKIEGSGQSISYTEGGKFTVSDRFLYVPGMEQAEVLLRATAQYKNKTVDLPEVKIADGTIVTPLLLQKDYKVQVAGDKFDKNPTVTQKSNLYFLVDSWEVRSVELKSDETSNLFRFIDKAAKDSSEFLKLEVYGFASPEGELDRNSKLSINRADEGAKLVMNRFAKAKIKGYDKKEGFMNKVTTDSEDWEGLRKALQTSSVNGKDAALNIISSVSDPEAREQQFRELASYDPIYEEIFPKLRRAEINLVAKLKVRNDDQIRAMALSTPDSLGMEELMYAASLQASNDDKFKVYQSFARRFPEDFRGFNNMGYIYFLQGKYGEAQSEFEKASKVASNNAMVQNNLGAMAAIRGDKKAAAGYFSAAGNAAEVNYNKGNLAVANGKYSDAVSNFGSTCSFNAALAKLLAGNASGATQTLDCTENRENAEVYYLRAVIAARSGNKDAIATNLAKAIAADGKLKNRAKTDKEFSKYAAELSSVLN
jgi:tetratricopeptide (TPR) repeat protein